MSTSIKPQTDEIQQMTTPIDSNLLYKRWIKPISENNEPTIWNQLADAFNHKWSDSAVVLLLQRICFQDNGEHQNAINSLKACLKKDKGFWLAVTCPRFLYQGL